MKKIVAIGYDGLCTFEFGIVVEIFGLFRPEFSFPWYDFEVCSASGATFGAVGGVKIIAQSNLSVVTTADTVIVPGWREPYESVPPDLIDAIRKAYGRGARIVSICGGTFVLAAAGILDGRPATTHWKLISRLARAYPSVHVRKNILYTVDNNVLTSAGSSAGIDLSLHIVLLDYGEEIASQVAQRLLAHSPRADFDPQLQSYTSSVNRDPRLAKIMKLLLAKKSNINSVAAMACVANISERSLHRKFKAALGMSPSEWLSREQISRAKQFLLHSDLSIEEIAGQCGFASADVFRRKFKSVASLSPSAFRQSKDIS